MLKRTLRSRWIIGFAVMVAMVAAQSAWAALTPAEDYTVILSKVNSNGTTSDLASVIAKADGNGKVAFTFTDVPNASSVNFLYITIKDSNGSVVRQSLAPAPPAGSTNAIGVNGLSYTQTKAILQGAVAAGTDDPIFAAFGFVLFRQPGLSDADISNIITGGKNAILGTGGFVPYLSDNGVTATQLASFRSNLVANSNSGNKDLADFASQFKTAVDNSFTSADQATQDLAKAGGYMGDIFIDAANAAGIDLSLILAAFDAAGQVADSDSSLNSASTTVMTGMQQSMKNFFMRIATAKVKREYTANLNIMGASASQVERFNSGIDTLISGFETLDAKYGKYWEDPENNPMTPAIRTAMDNDFMTSFRAFEGNIASTNAEITTMRQAWATALTVDVSQIPSDLGTMRDETGTSKNWAIPQTVLNTQVATNVRNGGSLSFTRQTYAIPSFMSWLTARTDFVAQGVPASLAALMGIEEDLRIAEFAKFALFAEGQAPTRAQERAAEATYKSRQDVIVDAIGGTTNGTTAYSSAQKKAIVKLLMQPTLY